MNADISISPLVISETELKIRNAAIKGKELTLGMDAPEINAELFYYLFHGLPLTTESGATLDPHRIIKIDLSGAKIRGPLQLQDLAGTGDNYAPSLSLEDCEIPDPIDLSYARIRSLSLKKSRIRHLKANGLKLEGSLDLSSLSSYEDTAVFEATGDQKTGAPDSQKIENIKKEGSDESEKVRMGICQVELAGATISGDFIAPYAKFCSPYKAKENQSGYALNARGLSLAGRVLFEPNVKASGGISFQDASIQGDIWMRGIQLFFWHDRALNCQSMQTKGLLMLSQKAREEYDDPSISLMEKTRIKGHISLVGTRIEGFLDFSGARIEHKSGEEAINAERLSIQKSLIFGKDFLCTGEIYMNSAFVEGDLEFESATLENSIFLSNLRTGGSLNARSSRFNTSGEFSTCIDLTNAIIEKDLYIKGSREKKEKEPDLLGSLHLAGAQVRGQVSLRQVTIQSNSENSSAIFAQGIQIGEDLLILAAHFPGTGTDFKNAKVTGDLRIIEAEYNQDLDLRNAFIGGEASFVDSRFNLSRKMVFAFSLLNASIGQDLTVIRKKSKTENESDIDGGINLASTRIAGQFFIQGVTIQSDSEHSPAIFAPGIQIGEELFVFDNSFPGGGTDFRNAKINRDVKILETKYSEGLDLHHAEIGGEVRFSNSRFNLSKKKNTAINLMNASVGQNLILLNEETKEENESDVYGTMNLASTRITGQCIIQGVTISADPGKSPAIFAQGIEIRKNLLILSVHFPGGGTDFTNAKIIGDVKAIETNYSEAMDFHHAEIGGEARFINSRFNLSKEKKTSINLLNASIGQDLIFISEKAKTENEFDVYGTFNLVSTRITGQFLIKGVTVQSDSEHSAAIFAPGIHIGEDLLITTDQFSEGGADFANAKISGNVVVDRSEIGGKFNFRNSLVEGGVHFRDSTFNRAKESSVSLDLTSVSVKKSLSFNGRLDKEKGESSCIFFNSVLLNNTIIGLDFSIDGSFFNCDNKNSIFARGVNTGGDASITNSIFADGAIHFANSKIGKDLHFTPQVSHPVSFSGIEVLGNFYLGTEDSSQPSFQYQITDSTWPKIRLNESIIKNRLVVRNLEVTRCSESNIENMYTEELQSRLDDFCSDGAVFFQSSLELPFYPGWKIVQFRREEGDVSSVISLLSNGERSTIVTEASSLIHSLNEMTGLNIQNKKNAKKYLRFFCEHVWGDEGPFTIVERISDLKTAPEIQKEFQRKGDESDRIKIEDGETKRSILKKIRPVTITKTSSGAYRAKAIIHYENGIFASIFVIQPGGEIEMVEDTPLASLPSPVLYNIPFTCYNRKKINFHKTRRETELPVEQMKDALKNARPIIHSKVQIDLTNTKVGALDDRNGDEWGNSIVLVLRGFVYSYLYRDNFSEAMRVQGVHYEEKCKTTSSEPEARTGLRERVRSFIKKIAPGFFHRFLPDSGFEYGSPWRSRARWLKLQYRSGKETVFEYRPHPYLHLAQILRSQGQDTDAKEISKLRLGINAGFKSNPASRFLLYLFGFFFDHGLSAEKAWLTLFIIWILGTLGVWSLNNHQYLILDSVPTADMAIQTESSSDPLQFLVSGIEKSNGSTAEAQILCGDSINSAIYALDVMIPLIDFRQEFRCHIRNSFPERDLERKEITAEPGPVEKIQEWIDVSFTLPNLFLWLKAIYTMVGWLVSSLAFLTISGILRRQLEEK